MSGSPPVCCNRCRAQLKPDRRLHPRVRSFANALGDALQSVSQAQQQSSGMQRQFQAGAEGVGIEETMLSMQKAQIGFQAALAVRNRLVSAYTDIMNMSV